MTTHSSCYKELSVRLPDGTMMSVKCSVDNPSEFESSNPIQASDVDAQFMVLFDKLQKVEEKMCKTRKSYFVFNRPDWSAEDIEKDLVKIESLAATIIANINFWQENRPFTQSAKDRHEELRAATELRINAIGVRLEESKFRS